MKLALTTDTHFGFSHTSGRVHETFLRKLRAAIEQSGAKILIHSGDWATVDYTQAERSMRQFTKALPSDVEILAVLGNHDLWNKGRFKKNPREIKDYLALVMKELGICYLERESFVKDRTLITGFDGWYHQPAPPTNDKHWMAEFTDDTLSMTYLSKTAEERFSHILAQALSAYEKKILVTHMSPYSKTFKDLQFSANPRMYPLIDGVFDLLVVGHSHREQDEVVGQTRILNVGGDYNKPEFRIIDI